MKLKVCGITTIEQVQQLEALGVDFAGMIFYNQSSRYVLPHMQGEEVRRAKLSIKKIGVFVNASLEEVLKQVNDFELDMVQLHGDESPEYCRQLTPHVAVIKALHVDETTLEISLEKYEAVDMVLYDTAGKGYGGTGKKFNWDVLSKGSSKPYFLSGGIGPNDVDAIKEFLQCNAATNLAAIDINSHFESAPGIKNMQLLQQFMNELKEAGLLHQTSKEE